MLVGDWVGVMVAMKAIEWAVKIKIINYELN